MPTCLGPGQPGKKALRCAGLNQTSWQGLLDALKMSMDSPGLLAPKLTGFYGSCYLSGALTVCTNFWPRSKLGQALDLSQDQRMVTLRAEGWGDSLGPPTSCPPWAFASPVFLHYIFNVSLMERDGVYVYTMISTLGNYCSGLSHAHQATPKHGGLK